MKIISKNKSGMPGYAIKIPSLDFCLTGYKNNKKKFFNEILKTKPETNADISFQTLESEISFLEEGDTEIKAEIPEISLNIGIIENDPIFQDIIVGKKDNPFSGLIGELDNSDWVKKGLSFIDSQKKCPFCQRELGEKILINLNDYFDKTYSQRIEYLDYLRTQYEKEIKNLPDPEALKREQFAADCPAFITEFINLKMLLFQNLETIDKKISEPNRKIKLTDTKSRFNKLNHYIDAINHNIREHNDRINRTDEINEKIRVSFLRCVRRENEAGIKQYFVNKSKYTGKLEKLRSEKDNHIPGEIQKENEIISENLDKITNLESSVNSINDYLRYLAISGFQIKKFQTNFYRIVRENNSGDQFKSLSEGEKTIISFLYFLELCQGSVLSNSSVDKDKRIIIIDDPVSSLSYTYVFNIADLIKSRIIDTNYASVCILTHNLYFFHELCMRTKKP
ncbi:wobble nucleotide-excising tRNase [Methanomicrobium sp. W14]|uniref:AAA family ATPase n=1 Tax=Methanomicrobium sp. W14 TaxID=2817839 RepID=UPI001AE90203|nr:AAA family ATPase [Methanomicrobium sp. W14]MBP2132359.1 wobble nucleotide-excising tRNase [Methanomicrobium sp. W14]